MLTKRQSYIERCGSPSEKCPYLDWKRYACLSTPPRLHDLFASWTGIPYLLQSCGGTSYRWAEEKCSARIFSHLYGTHAHWPCWRWSRFFPQLHPCRAIPASRAAHACWIARCLTPLRLVWGEVHFRAKAWGHHLKSLQKCTALIETLHGVFKWQGFFSFRRYFAQIDVWIIPTAWRKTFAQECTYDIAPVDSRHA